MEEKIESYLYALSRVLINERKKQELSQSQLALKAGIDRSYISDIEREKRNPSYSVLIQIAEALGYSISVLMLKVDYFLEMEKEKL